VNSLQGEFTGLAMLCFLYVAMQQLSPGTDIGFNLSEEYAVAKKRFERRP
jgi:hypothetical protein